MVSSVYTLLLSLSLFAARGTATPVERIFLTNCGTTLYNWQTSIAAYYSNNAEEVEGELPTALADFGRVITWEGSLITTNLNNGESFSAQLQSNAASEKLNSVVGQVITSQEVWQCENSFLPYGLAEAWTQPNGMNCYVLYTCTNS